MAAGAGAGAWTVYEVACILFLRVSWVLILVFVLPAVQTMRKSFQSHLALLLRLSWWDKHCDVHRGVSRLQDFQLVGGDEWWDYTVTLCACLRRLLRMAVWRWEVLFTAEMPCFSDPVHLDVEFQLSGRAQVLRQFRSRADYRSAQDLLAIPSSSRGSQ